MLFLFWDRKRVVIPLPAINQVFVFPVLNKSVVEYMSVQYKEMDNLIYIIYNVKGLVSPVRRK